MFWLGKPSGDPYSTESFFFLLLISERETGSEWLCGGGRWCPILSFSVGFYFDITLLRENSTLRFSSAMKRTRKEHTVKCQESASPVDNFETFWNTFQKLCLVLIVEKDKFYIKLTLGPEVALRKIVFIILFLVPLPPSMAAPSRSPKTSSWLSARQECASVADLVLSHGIAFAAGFSHRAALLPYPTDSLCFQCGCPLIHPSCCSQWRTRHLALTCQPVLALSQLASFSILWLHQELSFPQTRHVLS